MRRSRSSTRRVRWSNEQGDETLPGVFVVGDVEYFGAPDQVFPVDSHIFLDFGAKFGEIFMQKGEDVTEATGLVEEAVEFLTATNGVGLGEFRPIAGGGEFPEDGIEQEALAARGRRTRRAAFWRGHVFEGRRLDRRRPGR